ncbi:thiamine pyrophosphate-dependent dehydrogenase E1 component subunit alpha [Microbaculum marinum]|uniref:2-oxoisovalerate dehydrogenase subunit alpha n=1 Tax=Microbaculum marinum TaxID=1764581 RepID=A0AAW9RY51_9HYPH
MTAAKQKPRAATNTDVDLGLSLLHWMDLSRAIEDRLHVMKRQGRLPGRLVSGRGQEAIPVGATLALEAHDIVCPLHRDLGANLVKGITPTEFLCSYLWKTGHPSQGRDSDVHIGDLRRGIYPMISHLPDSWPVALGFGMASTRLGLDRVTLAFCGDGATSTGAWHETLNMSAVFRTPNVWVIENNKYAYSTPLAKQYAITSLADRAAAYGMPGVEVDGNDAIAVHETVRQAVDRARGGGGPTLIEAHTMRIEGHAVHDDASYVPKELIAEWKARDPIDALRGRLLAAGVEAERLEAIAADNKAAVGAAVAAAEAAPQPEPSGSEEQEVYAPPSAGDWVLPPAKDAGGARP